MLEFVLVFPIILTLLLGCMQIAHIWVARQVASYAPFCAARAALVSEKEESEGPARQAARQVCIWAIIGQALGEPEIGPPGWGRIPGSGAFARKIMLTDYGENNWNVNDTVQFDFGLVMPIAGPVIGWLVNPWEQNSEWIEQHADETGNIGNVDAVRYPHLRFMETVFMPKPYIILAPTGLGM